jgi:hypothetical protein
MTIKNLIASLLLIFSLVTVPVYASGPYRSSPPPPTPTPTAPVAPEGDNDRNYIPILILIGIGVCIWKKCLQEKPVKAEAGITPEIPQNEYIIIRPKQ